MWALAACGGQSGTVGGDSCAVDGDCAQGTICVAGACVVTECKTWVECEDDGRICIDDVSGKSSTGKVCTGKECTNDADCPNGGICNNSLCSGGGSGGCTSDNDCGDGKICDTATGSCTEAAPGAPVGSCDPCTADSGTTECPEGLSCVQVGPTWHCTAGCGANAECTSGWKCGLNGTGPNCVPGSFQCSGCLIEGCQEEGAICMADSGVCAVPTKTCEVCTKDGQCGAGKRCVGKGGAKHCIPECGDGNCPDNGECSANNDGVKVCLWKTEGLCCLGPECGGPDVPNPCDNIECSGKTPVCKGGKCVGCMQDKDCPEGTCEPATNVCSGDAPVCSGDTPIWNAGLNKCCECSGSTHCGGNACDGCACATGGNNDCAKCVAPYPGCAEYEKKWVCVQCSDDSHCTPNICNTDTYTCEGGGGPPVTGDCQTKGCTNPAQECDQESGLCYNPGGNCDDVTEFCPNGGKCVSELEAIFACFPGGGGGIPGLPGGQPGAGTCECDMSLNNCPSGLACGADPFSLFLSLLDPSCKPPTTCQAP